MSDRRGGKRGLLKDDRADDTEDGGGSDQEEEVASFAKRPRCGNDNKDAAQFSSESTIDLFSEGLIVKTVFSFLDVKELLRLTMCSKFVGEQVTHEHVVVSAMIHGGNAICSMDRLVCLLQY